MAHKSKRWRACFSMIEAKRYRLEEALQVLMSMPKAKFSESIELSCRLSVDPRKADQAIRSAFVLPHGTGKVLAVAVFAQGEQASQAEQAGADVVGMEDLAEKLKADPSQYQVVIATPQAMKLVGTLGPILGPRGLMPNPKTGTVTADVASAVTNAKAGQIRFRTDKAGIIHAAVGKSNFSADALAENIRAFAIELRRLKPVSAKGHYFKKMHLATTMGAGIELDVASVVST